MVRVIIVLILIDLFVRSSASHTIIDLYASDYGVTHKEPLKLILNQSFTIYVHSNKYALEIRCYNKERGVIIDSIIRLKNNCYVSDKKTIVTAAMDGIWNCELYYNSHGLSTSSQLQPDYKLFKLEAKVIVLQNKTYNDMSKVPNTATVKNQNDDNTTLSKKEAYSNKEMEMYITTNRSQSERESPSKSFWYIISALIIVVLAVVIAVTIIEVRKKINARKVNSDNNDNFDVDVSTIVSRPPLPLPSEMCEDNESVQYTTVYGRGTPGWS